MQYVILLNLNPAHKVEELYGPIKLACAKVDDSLDIIDMHRRDINTDHLLSSNVQYYDARRGVHGSTCLQPSRVRAKKNTQKAAPNLSD